MTPKELLKTLQANGWQVQRQRGSHQILKHPVMPGMIVLPLHSKDLKPGTLNNILRTAGLK